MKNILILCGGESAEHEVSILSARNIVDAIDLDQFNPIVVVVNREGTWFLLKQPSDLHTFDAAEEGFSQGEICGLMRLTNKTSLLTLSHQHIQIDAAFPMIHGTRGEDGTLQGLLELMHLPYVGSGVTGSLLGMDKDLMKRLLKSAGIPIAPFKTLSNQDSIFPYDELLQEWDTNILFIKPTIMGSSVGISKVKTKNEYYKAIEHAFQYCSKVMIEKYVPGREIECSILGNQSLEVSCIGEVFPSAQYDFYSYEAKYFEDGVTLKIPADLSANLAEKIQAIGKQAFLALECKGYARIDYFLTADNEIYINELNTIPGFTSTSMYPKLWEASGLPYKNLVTKLITLAHEEHERKKGFILQPEALMKKAS